jgi:hypothetical protein
MATPTQLNRTLQRLEDRHLRRLGKRHKALSKIKRPRKKL